MEKSASLYFKNGSSDKVYHTQLEKSGNGFVVNFQYGKRGSTLKNGTKTQEPVEYEKAVKIFEKLVKSKTSKGYSPGEEGVKFDSPELSDRVSGETPQLLNEIKNETEVLSFISDSNVYLQEKFDGERRMVRKDANETVGINKKGLTVALPTEISNSVKDNCLLDGEQVGDMLYVWDVLSFNGKCLKQEPYTERLKVLNKVSLGKNVKVVKTAKTKKEKEALYQSLKESNKEGVVVKQKAHKYVSGRPNSGGDVLKFKFYKTATVRVASHTQGKRSVQMEMIDSNKVVPVGKVTIPSNHKIPQCGDFIEVRYLYAYKGGSLFQPTFLGFRNDQDKEDINLNQLVYKSES